MVDVITHGLGLAFWFEGESFQILISKLYLYYPRVFLHGKRP